MAIDIRDRLSIKRRHKSQQEKSMSNPYLPGLSLNVSYLQYTTKPSCCLFFSLWIIWLNIIHLRMKCRSLIKSIYLSIAEIKYIIWLYLLYLFNTSWTSGPLLLRFCILSHSLMRWLLFLWTIQKHIFKYMWRSRSFSGVENYSHNDICKSKRSLTFDISFYDLMKIFVFRSFCECVFFRINIIPALLL